MGRSVSSRWPESACFCAGPRVARLRCLALIPRWQVPGLSEYIGSEEIALRFATAD